MRCVRRLLRHISRNFWTSTNVNFVASRHVFHVLQLGSYLPGGVRLRSLSGIFLPEYMWEVRTFFGELVILPAELVSEKPDGLIFLG